MGNLTIGDPAPAIEALDQEGKRITLEEYRGKKLVLYFIRQYKEVEGYEHSAEQREEDSRGHAGRQCRLGRHGQ